MPKHRYAQYDAVAFAIDAIKEHVHGGAGEEYSNKANAAIDKLEQIKVSILKRDQRNNQKRIKT